MDHSPEDHICATYRCHGIKERVMCGMMWASHRSWQVNPSSPPTPRRRVPFTWESWTEPLNTPCSSFSEAKSISTMVMSFLSLDHAVLTGTTVDRYGF